MITQTPFDRISINLISCHILSDPADLFHRMHRRFSRFFFFFIVTRCLLLFVLTVTMWFCPPRESFSLRSLWDETKQIKGRTGIFVYATGLSGLLLLLSVCLFNSMRNPKNVIRNFRSRADLQLLEKKLTKVWSNTMDEFAFCWFMRDEKRLKSVKQHLVPFF